MTNVILKLTDNSQVELGLARTLDAFQLFDELVLDLMMLVLDITRQGLYFISEGITDTINCKLPHYKCFLRTKNSIGT